MKPSCLFRGSLLSLLAAAAVLLFAPGHLPAD